MTESTSEPSAETTTRETSSVEIDAVPSSLVDVRRTVTAELTPCSKPSTDDDDDASILRGMD